jgi:hypothetical protein
MERKSWCRLREATFGLMIALAVFIAAPGKLRAQAFLEELILNQSMLDNLIQHPAQDAPSGLQAPGERVVTRLWAATDVYSPAGPGISGGSCFVPPPPQKPTSEGICARTVDELLQTRRPKPGTETDPLFDVSQALNQSLRMYGNMLQWGPTDALKPVKEAVEAYNKRRFPIIRRPSGRT